NGLERSGLLDSLRERVQELTETQSLLETYNQNLETLVAERTHDLQVTFYTLQSIFQNTADGIVTLNRDLVVTSMNRAVQKWLKIKSQAFTWKPDMKHPVLGQPIESLLTLGSGKSLAAIFQQLSESLESNESPNSVILKEAFVNKIPVEVSIAPIPEDDVSGEGKLGENYYVLVLRDIVERKEIERLRDDFMSTLTHDLRTPLLAAIQTLGFFVDGSLGSLPPRQVEVLNMLINSNREMLGLVNVLLEVYKYESGKQRLILDTLDLKELAETVIAELQSIATNKNQLLEATIPEHLPRILADKRELRRVLVNLIGNALNYTQPGGRVFLSVIHDPDWVTISVEDNGRGIPASDLPSLFQRFSQGTSKQRSSGIGLGLYLSRQIVEAHHGTIGVDSTEGVGSRFWLNLPISLRDMEAGTIDLSALQG
ncbi:MAG: PAS domain-containing sensor histidine kinase, partial [Cyanobacteria bacterium]|nr:PAS domain-containing sensor histidine kinase [Cyanobacteriota bacterium]